MPARHYYGLFLTGMGRFDEALGQLRRAEEVDPLLLPIKASLGFSLYFARRYDEAITHLERLLEMDASFLPAHHILYWCFSQRGEKGKALRAMERAVELSGHSAFYLASFGCALAESGRVAEAQAILAELTALSPGRYVSGVQLAAIHVALGQSDGAFAALDKAFAERAWQLVFLDVEPAMDPLRADPRFADLLRRIGL